jgi:hypothetical protein
MVTLNLGRNAHWAATVTESALSLEDRELPTVRSEARPSAYGPGARGPLSRCSSGITPGRRIDDNHGAGCFFPERKQFGNASEKPSAFFAPSFVTCT